MKKIILAGACALMLGGVAFGTPKAIATYAEGTEEITSVEVVSEETELSSVELSEIVSMDSSGEAVPASNDWEKFVAEYLNAEKVAMYMSWVAYIGTIIGLVANINKLKKAKTMTVEDAKNEIEAVVRTEIDEKIPAQIERFLPSVLKTQEATNEALKIFAKILALSQENSPESRVAILELIEQLGLIGKDITDSAKESIEEEKKAIAEKEQEIAAKIDEIVDKYDGTEI